MSRYQNFLWGYSLTYSDEWTMQEDDDAVILTAPVESYPKPRADEHQGRVMIRPEWNPEHVEVQKLWSLHIGKIAGVIGAKRLGAAPWQLGALTGMEAELAMPKKDPLRLWTGILQHDRTIYHLLVTHHKLDRDWFEPQATNIIRSLRVHAPAAVQDEELTFPLPPGYQSVNPLDIIEDIDDASAWQAFTGSATVAALQAFYARELPSAGWNIVDYDPLPGPAEPGFARFALQRSDVHLVLGILPIGDDSPPSTQAGTIMLRQLPLS